MTSSATSKKTGFLTPRVMKVLSLAGAFLVGAAVVFLIYQVTGGGGSRTAHGGPPPVVEEEKPAGPDKRRLIKDMLLPRDVKPSSYNLKLKAYLPGYGAAIPKDKELSFDAAVVLHLKAESEVNEVVLNSAELTFKKEHCFAETTKGKVSVSDVVLDEHLQRATFKLSKPVKGEFTLEIIYEGKIRPQLNGLYQTKYTNAQGQERIAAVTQMEPQDARKMVPCFDEPEWKASWNVTIVHPKGTSAVSNGIERGEPRPVNGNFLETSFKPTPVMSSYLLAVLISEFTYVEGYTKNGVRFRIYSRPEAKATTAYALQSGIKCLTGLEDFYGVKFPLEKQDMVALPDFAMGAMENWGLITYRETALLYDPKNYNMENKRRVATVIAHELAHMWFGDLVTMKWWNDIWLNEGFASTVENIGVDIISDGKFDMENTFVAEQHSFSLTEDSSRSSHPIINDVEYNEEIDDLFDAISYKKGATFISMVNHLLGKENFQKGIKSYFDKYAYQNTEHGQLFAEWDKAVPDGMKGPDGKKLSVTEFALKWTTQMGYPYLSLVKHNTTHDEVTQTRYLINPNAPERPKFANPKYKYKYDVPVWYQVGTQKEVKLAWLPYDGQLYLPKTSEAVVLNADSYAIARMNFDKAGWKKILDQLKADHTVYSQRSRYRIVSDVFAMAEIDKIPYDVAFDFAQYIVKEESRLPWMAFLNSLDSLDDYWGSTPGSKAIDDYKKQLLKPIAEKLDIKALVETVNSSEEQHIAKGIKVTQWLIYCAVDKKACKQLKDEIFEEKFRQPCSEDAEASQCSEVPPAIRVNIYCSAVRDGDDDKFQLILAKYKKETLQLESRQLLRALTCSHDVVTLKWLMGEVLNRGKGIVRGQDVGTVFLYLSGNEVASEFLLDFLFENWDQIHKQYSDEQSILNHIIEGSASNIQSKYQLEKLKSFVKDDKKAQKYFVFTKMEHKAAKRIEWLEKNGAKMVDLIREKTRQL